MILPALLIASLMGSVPVAEPAPGHSRSLWGSTSLPGRSPEAAFKLVELTALRLPPDLLGMQGAPWSRLDYGSGASADRRSLLALALGLVLGFGTGHLVTEDRDGFILFLVVDVAIIAFSSVLSVAAGTGLFWGLGSVGLLVSHILQGLDAYAKAGGPRAVELTRRRAVELAALAGGTRDMPLVTTRALGFSF